MSEAPPPPQVSPDGKFYWDGTRWAPMSAPAEQAAPHGRRHTGRIVAIAVIAILVTAMGAFAAGAFITGGFTTGGFDTGLLPTSCTVGISGTAVNITIEGRGAVDACNSDFPFAQDGLNGVLQGRPVVTNLTPVHVSSFGDVVCVVRSVRDSAPTYRNHPVINTRGLTYTVRDTGLRIVGNAVCHELQRSLGTMTVY